LRCDGVTAPCVFDGAINGEKFLAYVEQVLTPTLSPGDIVIILKTAVGADLRC
jgi:transposase